MRSNGAAPVDSIPASWIATYHSAGATESRPDARASRSVKGLARSRGGHARPSGDRRRRDSPCYAASGCGACCCMESSRRLGRLAAVGAFWWTKRKFWEIAAVPIAPREYPICLLLLWFGALGGAYALGTANLALAEISGGARSILGGIFGAVLVAELYKRLRGVSGPAGAVYLVLPLALGAAVGRVVASSPGLRISPTARRPSCPGASTPATASRVIRCSSTRASPCSVSRRGSSGWSTAGRASPWSAARSSCSGFSCGGAE